MTKKDVDKFSQRFAEHVKRYRKEQNLSHDKLAEMSGVTRTTISNIEACRKSPTIATCYRVANSLKIKLSDLIKESE